MPEFNLDRNGVFFYEGDGEDEFDLADEGMFLVEQSWYFCLPLGDGHFATLDPIGPYNSKREATAAAQKVSQQGLR